MKGRLGRKKGELGTIFLDCSYLIIRVIRKEGKEKPICFLRKTEQERPPLVPDSRPASGYLHSARDCILVWGKASQ